MIQIKKRCEFIYYDDYSVTVAYYIHLFIIQHSFQHQFICVCCNAMNVIPILFTYYYVNMNKTFDEFLFSVLFRRKEKKN